MSNPHNSTLLRAVNPPIDANSTPAPSGADPPHGAEGAEGLVYCQQSSAGGLPAAVAAAHTRQRGRVVLSAEAAERQREKRAERAERVRRLALVRGPLPSYEPAKRYSAVVESDDDSITIDSVEARVRRCQRRVHAWASALPHDNRAGYRYRKAKRLGPRAVMLTLTYADKDAWEPLQIRDFMKAMARLLGDNLYGYAWVLEMQKREAPHYHVLLYVKRGTRIERPDDRLWKYGTSRIETAKSLYYICKYSGKMYQKERLPKGARMFAVQINAELAEGADMWEFRLSTAPVWLQEKLKEIAEDVGGNVRWKRAEGGGWLIRETGEILPSPWRVRSIVLMD